MGATISRIKKLLVAPTLAVVLAISDSTLAAERTLWWEDDISCPYSVSFDPAKQDEAQLRNTVNLLFGHSDFEAPVGDLPFDPQSIYKLDLDQLKRQCSNALDATNRAKFIPLKGVEDYRRAKIAEIKDACKFETVKIRGFRDLSALREYQPAAACLHFIDVLECNGDIMTVFRETLDQNCSRSISPASCVERELANSRKANGMEWVRLYLMTFGWNNCANKFTIRADPMKQDQMRAELQGLFRRRFKITRPKCDQ
jgi:hypothetical protein